MTSLGKALAVFAVVLIGGALLLALRPVTSEAGFDCGNALAESDNLGSDELTDTFGGGDGESGCDKARQDAQTLPIVLGILGVAAGGALFTQTRRSEPDGP